MTPSRDPDLRVDAELLLVTLIWGVNFSVVKSGLEQLHPLAFNALRFPLAGAVLLVLLRSRGPLTLPDREDVPRIVGLGLLGNVVYQLFFIYGIDRTLAGNASLLLSTTPAWAIVLATLRGQERPGWRAWTGVAATVVGMVAVVLGGQQKVALGGATLTGDLLAAGGAVIWAVYTVESRDLVRRYGALRLTAWTLWSGGLVLVAMGLPAVAGTGLASLPPGTWLEVGFAGVFAIAVAYVIWYRGVGQVGSTRTAVYSNVVPVVALAVAWAWLGEQPTWLQVVGAVVVIGGMTLARLGEPEEERPVSVPAE